MPTFYSRVSAYLTGIGSRSGRETPWIECDTQDGHLVRIDFMPESVALPPNFTAPLYPDHPEFAHIQYAKIFAGSGQFVWYLDLLRNEESFVRISTDDPNLNHVRAGWSHASWGHIE